MTQYARPDNDITRTNVNSGTYTDVDEVTASDSDYLYGTNNTAVTYECSLQNPTDPNIHTGHTIRYRVVKTYSGTPSGTGSTTYVTAYLYQGGTLIATDTQRTLDGTWTQYDWTISEAEAANITDYSDLRVRFYSPASGGSVSNRRSVGLSWVVVEVPDVILQVDCQPGILLGNGLQATITVPASETVNSLPGKLLTFGVPNPEAISSTANCRPGLCFGFGLVATVTATSAAMVELALSDDIPAGGATATTAQLTPPGSKSTSDFQAGKISDDTNPLGSINLTTDKYTELEWCIQFTAIAVASEQYEFRATISGTPLDSYPVTPRLTVAAEAVNVQVDCLPGFVLANGEQSGVTASATITGQPGRIGSRGLSASIFAGYTVNANPGMLLLMGMRASVTASVAAAARPGILLGNGSQAGVVGTAGVATQAGAMLIATLQADVSATSGETVNCQPGMMLLTGAQAGAAAGVGIAGQAGKIATIGLQAVVSAGASETVSALPGAGLLAGSVSQASASAGITSQAGVLLSRGEIAQGVSSGQVSGQAGFIFSLGLTCDVSIGVSEAVAARAGIGLLSGSVVQANASVAIPAILGLVSSRGLSSQAAASPGVTGRAGFVFSLGLTAQIVISEGDIVEARPGMLLAYGLVAQVAYTATIAVACQSGFVMSAGIPAQAAANQTVSGESSWVMGFGAGQTDITSTVGINGRAGIGLLWGELAGIAYDANMAVDAQPGAMLLAGLEASAWIDIALSPYSFDLHIRRAYAWDAEIRQEQAFDMAIRQEESD